MNEEHDEHAPDCKQSISDRVRHGVTETGNLAAGGVADHAERGRRGSRPGDRAKRDRVVEAENVFSEIHTENERYRRGDDAPQEHSESELLKPGYELRAGG